MKSLRAISRLKEVHLQPAYFRSRSQCNQQSVAFTVSQHLHTRSLQTTNRLLSSSQPHPQPEDQPPQQEPHPSPEEPQPTPQPKPLIYPTRPTPSPHHDLPSFLSHAARTSLTPKSTVYIGTHYEYTVLTSLSTHGFSLRRIGGASDFGIDLLGTWSLPSLRHPLRVIIQCKALASPRASSVRELEGAFIGAPTGWRKGDGEVEGSNVVGLLVAPGPSTKGVRDAIARSRWPMGFVSCGREDGAVRQFIWNQAALREGLEGVGVAFRHDEAGGEPRLVLTWKGRPIEGLGEKGEVGE